jgi:hypothetical protein
MVAMFAVRHQFLIVVKEAERGMRLKEQSSKGER